MREDTPKPNAFCHIVIPAPDLEAAKAFYESVFHWQVQANVPGEKYWFFQSGNVGGAFSADRQPAPHSVQLIIQVVDMQAALGRIVQYGGTVTQPPSAIGEAAPGYDAYFLDPNQNEMGLYTPR